MLPFAPQASGSITLFQHKRDALYNTTVIGAGAGGVAASSDVWALLQSRGLDSFGGGATAAATMAAVSQLAEENACWREVCVDKAPLDALLTGKEASAARVVKIDVEGGEWAVIRGMSHLLGGRLATATDHREAEAHGARDCRGRSRPSGLRSSHVASTNCSRTWSPADSMHMYFMRIMRWDGVQQGGVSIIRASQCDRRGIAQAPRTWNRLSR